MLLFGDLHMHSTASDGQHDRFTLAQRAMKLRFNDEKTCEVTEVEKIEPDDFV